MISTQAMINAAGLPDALVTLVAIRSKNREKRFLSWVLDVIIAYFIDKRKTQATIGREEYSVRRVNL